MDGEGIMAFFESIKVDITDPIVLVIMYYMGASEQMNLKYEEFKKGCQSLNADTLEKWHRIIPDLKKSF